ncbi:MAG: aspartate aminotransferase family protein [Ferruginibacter sp.]
MNQRQLFLQHVGQTSPSPLAIEVASASGTTIRDVHGKEYLDLISGISVCNVGHGHPAVVKAVQDQAATYMHVMVYGEMVESPQVRYAHALTQQLPTSLNTVFFTTSGSEATEGAMKLAKRVTGRTKMISFYNAYHGSTQGALSLMGDEYWQQAFRPLLPGVTRLRYNQFADLDQIDNQTAFVLAETIQAEAGVLVPDIAWMQALRNRCTETGALLILDEIQCGFGRNGTLWAFEQFVIVPDIVLLGKAMGGGMPLGAFVADHTLMQALTHNPVLGHINTFGGHPVCCAAGLAAFEVLLQEKITDTVKRKEAVFLEALHHANIRRVSSCGLMMAVHFDTAEFTKQLIDRLIEKGLFTDWFLFAPNALRIAPALNISETDIRRACSLILETLNEMEP